MNPRGRPGLESQGRCFPRGRLLENAVCSLGDGPDELCRGAEAGRGDRTSRGGGLHGSGPGPDALWARRGKGRLEDAQANRCMC